MPDHAHVGASGPLNSSFEAVLSRRGREGLNMAERAIMKGIVRPTDFGFAGGLESLGTPDVEEMLRRNPAGLEAIIIASGRPSLLVREGKVEWQPIDDLPGFTADVAAKAANAIMSVGRVEFVNHRMGWGGTGFVVDAAPFGRRLVATNRHVAALVARRARDGSGVFLRSDRQVAYGARVDFREEIDAPRDISHELPVTYVRYLADDSDSDLAILEIAVHDELSPEPIPLSDRKAVEGELIAVIGYPARADQTNVSAMLRYFENLYGVKRFSPGLILNARSGEELTYDCTTLGGNSGSCLLSLETGTVLGVHYWGEEASYNAAVGVETLKRVLSGSRTQVSGSFTGSGETEAADRQTAPGTFGGRNGYDPAFLGHGLEVPLPRLTQELVQDLAIPSNAVTPEDAELRYRNFSILFSASRRMARLTAVNINGAQSVRIKRVEPDVWSFDLRIDADLQLPSSAYDDPSIDRGHLVRREDPNWGDAPDQANADTFHLTNSAPQHSSLNRSARFWLGLEDHIIDNARTHGFRATVFSGPVLREDDTPLGPLPVGMPLEFWKVVVMPAEAGGLLATGYLVSQGNFIAELRQKRRRQETVEGFQFGPYRAFQVPVAQIEELTGLDFGTLRTADPMASTVNGTEASADNDIAYVAIEDPRDLILGTEMPSQADPLAAISAELDRRSGDTVLARLLGLQDMLAADALYPEDLHRLLTEYQHVISGKADGQEAAAPSFGMRKAEYETLLATCLVRPSRKGEVAWALGRLTQFRPRYEAVGNPLGIPWWFVGITHALEASFNFGAHLHNGDPLTARTVQVPKGRPKTGTLPFSWEDSARDAMELKGLTAQSDWTAAHSLYRFEAYNGWGYFFRGLPSPYLWSFSQHYVKGKFVSDGKFDANAVSKQCGAGILMHELGILK